MKGEGSKSVPNLSKMMKCIGFGAVAGIILTLLFTLLGAFAMVKMETVMYPAVMPLAVAAVCLGSFGGGYLTARLHQSMGMAVGALCAVAVFVIFLGLGAVFGSQLGVVSLLRAVPAVISGAIGGILGVNRRKRRK